ncbi:MAG: hypothetical protein ACOC6G_00905, partial [Thermoproteota archaeon]
KGWILILGMSIVPLVAGQVEREMRRKIGNSKGSNPKKDINAGFLKDLKIKIEDLRKAYHNKMPTT